MQKPHHNVQAGPEKPELRPIEEHPNFDQIVNRYGLPPFQRYQAFPVDNERRNTPEENDRCTRILEALAVVVWLVAVYHLLGFLLKIIFQ